MSCKHYVLCLLLAISISANGENQVIDSLITVIPTLEDTAKFNAIFKLLVHLDRGRDERIGETADQGYAQFQNLSNPSEEIWNNASNFPYYQADHALYNDNFTEVLKKCDELSAHAENMEAAGFNSNIWKCNADFYRAIVYYEQEKDTLALETALLAISHLENPDTINQAIPVFSFLGNRYGQFKQFEGSSKYFGKAINFYENKLEKLDDTDLKEKEQYTVRLARVHYNRGSMYIQHNQFEQALPDLKISNEYLKNIESYLKIKVFIALNNIYSEIDNNQLAYNNLKSIEPNIKSERLSTQELFYEAMIKITSNLERHKEAFHYLNTHNILKDSLYKSANNRELKELQTKYKTKQKENEIIQLQSEYINKQNQNRLLWLLVSGLSLLAGFIFFQSKQKKKFEEKILKKDKEVLDMKENFFINITHQLRTPLSLIIAPLKELETTTTDDKSQLKIKQALNNGSRLLELFNQLLDWNKIEEQALKIAPQTIHLNASLTSIAERYQELAKQKDINFTTDFPEPTTYANLDFDKFEKIIGNLLSNAIKFTPYNGTVKFSANLKNEVLKIEVEDNGIGIEQSETTKIFDKYYQVGNGTNGAGFGLTFANELSKLLGGKLSVNSKPNEKTIFQLVLPIKIESEKPTKLVAPAKFEQTSKTVLESDLSLLIVEDNLELNNYLTTYFESKYITLSALNIKDALKITYEHAPDLIISDVMLPDGNGFEIVKELKNNTATNHIPILMLTAKYQSKDRNEAWATGADGWLTKPFDPNELNLVVSNLLDNRSRMQKKFSQLSEEIIRNNNPKVEDEFMQKLLKLLNENIENELYSIDELAANFPMNRTHFYQKVKAVSGTTPNKLFKELRLKRAKYLIAYQNKMPSEAALLTGFISVSHFSRSYKAFFNENPSETKAIT